MFFVHHSAVGFVVEIIGCHRWARVAEASRAAEECRAWCGWYYRTSLFKWNLCCELQDWQAFGRLKCTTGINGTVLHFVACKYIQNQLDGTVLFLKFSSSCHYTSPFYFSIYLFVGDATGSLQDVMRHQMASSPSVKPVRQICKQYVYLLPYACLWYVEFHLIELSVNNWCWITGVNS